jgi:hypothetical protein
MVTRRTLAPAASWRTAAPKDEAGEDGGGEQAAASNRLARPPERDSVDGASRAPLRFRRLNGSACKPRLRALAGDRVLEGGRVFAAGGLDVPLHARDLREVVVDLAAGGIDGQRFDEHGARLVQPPALGMRRSQADERVRRARLAAITLR